MPGQRRWAANRALVQREQTPVATNGTNGVERMIHNASVGIAFNPGACLVTCVFAKSESTGQTLAPRGEGR